jgi:hypothetical protein
MVKYTLLLLLLPFHLMAAMPPGVAPGATFDSRGHVWVLTANNQQVIWFENGVKKAEGPFEHNQIIMNRARSKAQALTKPI